MKKIKYYLETTVFNFVFADDDPSKKEITERLFNNWSSLNGEMYISEIVNLEISRAREDKKMKLAEIIQKYNPILLTLNEEVKELAEKYISEGVIPEKFRDDAFHIAIAVVSDLDVIVSWNLEHIVKLKTKLAVEGISRSLGYKMIEIVTPEEIL